MKRGTCVKCGQATVFAAVDGVSPGTNPPGMQWMVVSSTGRAARKQYIAVNTYACSSCGYLENYAEPGALSAATGGWTKVEPRS